MSIRSGLAAQMGIATESTWGTRVAPTRFHPILSESLTAEKDRVDSDSIYTGRRVRDSAQWDEGNIEAGGSIQMELYLKGLGLWLKHMFGGLVTAGAGPYTHTATPGDLDALSFSCQVVKQPRDATANSAWDFSGCKIPSWEMAIAVGEAATLGVEVSAKTVDRTQTTATWSPPTGLQRIMGHHVSVMTIHGVSPKVKSLRLRGTNGIETDRRFLGSQTIEEQDEVDIREYGGEAELEFGNETLYDAFWNGTEAAVAVTLARGTTSLAFTMNARLDGSTPVTEGRGKLTQTVPFVCVGTTDAAAITAVLTNGDATA